MGIAGVVWAASLLTQAGTDNEFPYVATIAHEAVLVRSGPGESFYPTCRLMKGAEVEVHRLGPNGWCAIRPPEGEFCLIAADGVKLLPGDDLVEVVGREATVWVGSHLAKPDPHRWQIHLQPGERAAVLGVRAGGQEGQAVAWYKIAPPAGEFRWIPREALARESPNAGETAEVHEAPQELPANELAEAKPLAGPMSAGEAPAAPTNDILPAPAGEVAVVDLNGVVQTSLETALESEGPPTPIPDEPPQEAPVEAPLPSAPAFSEADVRIEPQPRTSTEELEGASSLPGESKTPDERFDAEATALQVDLTLAVAHDLSRWRLGPLRDRAVRLHEIAPSPESRRHAEHLLASIERFEQLYNRYLQYAQLRRAPAWATRVAASVERDQFAASGQLAPLSPEIDAPPFALLDEQGNVQAFVTPAAGLDLMRYAGQTVGVSGLSTKDEKLQTLHVVAKEVKPLPR